MTVMVTVESELVIAKGCANNPPPLEELTIGDQWLVAEAPQNQLPPGAPWQGHAVSIATWTGVSGSGWQFHVPKHGTLVQCTLEDGSIRTVKYCAPPGFEPRWKLVAVAPLLVAEAVIESWTPGYIEYRSVIVGAAGLPGYNQGALLHINTVGDGFIEVDLGDSLYACSSVVVYRGGDQPRAIYDTNVDIATGLVTGTIPESGGRNWGYL